MSILFVSSVAPAHSPHLTIPASSPTHAASLLMRVTYSSELTTKRIMSLFIEDTALQLPFLLYSPYLPVDYANLKRAK